MYPMPIILFTHDIGMSPMVYVNFVHLCFCLYVHNVIIYKCGYGVTSIIDCSFEDMPSVLVHPDIQQTLSQRNGIIITKKHVY